MINNFSELLKSPVGIIVGISATLYIIEKAKGWFGKSGSTGYQKEMVVIIKSLVKIQEKQTDKVEIGFKEVSQDHNKILGALAETVKTVEKNHNQLTNLNVALLATSNEQSEEIKDSASMLKDVILGVK